MSIFGMLFCVVSMFGLPAASQAQNQKLQQALNRQTEVSVIEAPLTDAAATLQGLFDTEIRIHAEGLSEMGVSPDVAVHLEHENISLRSALHLLLRQAELDWITDGSAILITTPEEADSRLAKRRYQIGQAPPDEVIGLLTTCSNGQWIDVDGDGGEVSVTGPGVIEVTQTERSHREIEALFGELARVLNPRQAPKLPSVEAANKAIQAKLSRTRYRSQQNQQAVPLSTFAESLNSQHDIPVWIDVLQLEELGVSAQQEIDLPASATSLSSLLNQVLTPLELTWRVQHETLLITTMMQDEDYGDMPITVYNTSRLLGRSRTPQQLLSNLYAESGVENWLVNDGSPGTAFVIGNVLVVKQSAGSHRKIASWLQSLR